jgi:hypothetical protein
MEPYSPSISPDDDVFWHLATVYASTHPTMHLGQPCYNTDKGFEGGISNGAAWYPLTGGMQDYNYIFHGCMELTLEISCCKYPFTKELPKLWDDNREALLKYISQVHQGVRGVIRDMRTHQPIHTKGLKIEGRESYFRTTSRGEFWRILLPGTYKLLVHAPGYEPQTLEFTVSPTKQQNHSTPTWLDVNMPRVVRQTTVVSDEVLPLMNPHEEASTLHHTATQKMVRITSGHTTTPIPFTDITPTSMDLIKLSNPFKAELHNESQQPSFAEAAENGGITQTSMKNMFFVPSMTFVCSVMYLFACMAV